MRYSSLLFIQQKRGKTWQQSVEKQSKPCNSITCRTTFSSNNFEYLFSIWCFESISLLWGNFYQFFFTMLRQFIEVYRHSYMHSSLKVPPQHFNQVGVWTSTGSLQHLHSFIFVVDFQPFLGSLAFAWHKLSQVVPVRQRASHLTLEYFGIQRSSWWT